MNHDGAYPDNTKALFAPRWCIFSLSLLVFSGYNAKVRLVFQASQNPAGAPARHLSDLSESVIMGNMLPSEAFVLTDVDMEGNFYYGQG